LRQLGHSSSDGLTKERASALIDELLQAEKASGKTFPCLLPPFDECRHDPCERDYEPVSRNEVRKGARIAEWSDPEKQAKLKTRSTTSVSIRNKSKGGGCVGVLLMVVALATVSLWLANAM
jgi:hypothetical protein